MPSLTITYSAQEGQRVAAALGRVRGVDRPATEAEVKAALIGVMRGWVMHAEREDAEAAINITPPVLT